MKNTVIPVTIIALFVTAIWFALVYNSSSELDKIYNMQAENMEVLKYHKQEAKKHKDLSLFHYSWYMEAKEKNNKLYNQILWVVNSWSTNQELETYFWVLIQNNDISDEVLMWKICEYWQIHWMVTPLCNNKTLYDNLKKISVDKWVDFGLMVGITYAESHIGINYNPQKCSVTNNRSWKKREKYDDWSNSVKFNDSKEYVPWCWVYNFDTVEKFWNSFSNTLKFWYIDKWCATAECISKRYVWGNWEVSEKRAKRVNIFTTN